MARHSTELWRLATELLHPWELTDLRVVANASPLSYQHLEAFDLSLGGAGFANIESGSYGRYTIADRDVFRPLQYCRAYFDMICSQDDPGWLTREVVHMSALHIESLVKRISGARLGPLGQLLREPVVRSCIGATTWGRVDRFTRIYNDAKHAVDQPMDTHLFTTADAVVAYMVSRCLARSLYPYARLTTDLTIFN